MSKEIDWKSAYYFLVKEMENKLGPFVGALKGPHQQVCATCNGGPCPTQEKCSESYLWTETPEDIIFLVQQRLSEFEQKMKLIWHNPDHKDAVASAREPNLGFAHIQHALSAGRELYGALQQFSTNPSQENGEYLNTMSLRFMVFGLLDWPIPPVPNSVKNFPNASTKDFE